MVNKRSVRMKMLAKVLKIICNVVFWISVVGLYCFYWRALLFHIFLKRIWYYPRICPALCQLRSKEQCYLNLTRRQARVL